MRKVNGEGSYTRKATGEGITYTFDYPVYETFAELIAEIGEDRVLAISNQTLKEDSANNSREATKRANGDSTVKLMTAEEKEANKAEKKEKNDMYKYFKAQGLTLEDLKDIQK